MVSEHTPSGGPARRTALVTGASSGIGTDIALLLAERSFDLVLVARNRTALESVAAQCGSHFGAAAKVIVADLSQADEPQRILGELEHDGIAVDALVNNAGFGVQGRFAESDLAGELAIVQVNICALMALTRLFLPGMIQRGWGRILNVASTAALAPGPYLSTYYASKAFVLSHSIALAKELKHTGVKVTALCPGPTRTDFQRRAGMHGAKLFRFGQMSPMRVAKAGVRGMVRGKLVVFPGFTNKLSAFVSRFGGRGFAATITGKLNRG